MIHPNSNSKPKEHFIFVRLLHSGFESLGIFISKYYCWCAIISFLITLTCILHVISTSRTAIPYGYTPSNARSRDEIQVFEQFFNQEGRGVTIFIMIIAKDNKTMIRKEYLEETVDLLDVLENNITFENPTQLSHKPFSQFCIGFCEINQPVRQFYNGFQILWKESENGEQTKDLRVNLTYPMTEMFGRKFTIGQNFFGVRLKSNLNESDSTNIEFTKMIILQIRAEKHSSWSLKDIESYEIKISKYLVDNFTSDRINAMAVSQAYMQSEMTATGLEMEPFLIAGFILMCLFTVITTYISSTIARQFTLYKILLSITACIVPLMSTATTFSLIVLFGAPFSPILAITPFLILAIGVDDCFLMIHAQQRFVKIKRKKLNSDYLRAEDVCECIAFVCVETGPSILLSAFTNILAFCVGSITSPPEIQLFCLGNALAIFIDTIYQVTLYAAILAFVCVQEFNCADETCVDNFMNKFTQKLGIVSLQIDLNPHKFFLPGSQMLDAHYYKNEYIVPNMTPVMVFVNKPGNLSDPENAKQLYNIVEAFEHLPSAIGKDSTRFFLRDFEEYNLAMGEDPERINENDLDEFLKWPEYTFWKGFVKLNKTNDTTKLNAFFFSTGYHGEHLKKLNERALLLESWRNLSDFYKSNFDVTVYNDDAPVLDLIEVIPSVTWQSAVVTFMSMGFVVFWFLYDKKAIAIASTSIFFICLGVVGGLNWWGVDLDPIMMAIIIMTIGFSVDMPSHVAFHYHKISLEHPSFSSKQISEYTIHAVAFPIIQAGFSTIACVISLLWVKLYMGEVFVKSMTLCVILSLLQGLLIIPIMYWLLDEKISMCGKRIRPVQDIFKMSNANIENTIASPIATNKKDDIDPDYTIDVDKETDILDSDSCSDSNDIAGLESDLDYISESVTLDPRYKDLLENEEIVKRYGEDGREIYDDEEWINDLEAVKVTDRFGFVHKDGNIIETSELEKEKKTELSREWKWIDMIKEYDKSSKIPKKWRDRIWKGIPNKFRFQVWPKILNVDKYKKTSPYTYAQILERALVTCTDIKQIDLDINRTYRDHIAFKKRYDLKQKCLFNVLTAYAIYNTEVGYCQGMSQIAALFLMYMNEEDVFWCLHSLLVDPKWGMHGFFIPGFPSLMRYMDHFNKLVETNIKSLHKHIESEGIPTVYLTKWWFGCFLDRVPFNMALRLWDVFLLEGTGILVATGFTILKMHKSKFLFICVGLYLNSRNIE
uniref:SSD domain-containing protein n=1 Tax=Rhabditophanes sp. KR3021 TaxID=114890 RepID=A0AC35U5B9_9BILA